uniref:Uncharacterized protein n=1 Tax=Oryza barthii TaxID=65489 RepID=A0A0D3H7H3_9ORYZ
MESSNQGKRKVRDFDLNKEPSPDPVPVNAGKEAEGKNVIKQADNALVEKSNVHFVDTETYVQYIVKLDNKFDSNLMKKILSVIEVFELCKKKEQTYQKITTNMLEQMQGREKCCMTLGSWEEYNVDLDMETDDEEDGDNDSDEGNNEN